MPHLFILILFMLAGSSSHAKCPEQSFNYPTPLQIDSPAVLIVTHASYGFDARLSSKRGIDEAVRYARRNDMPVIYLEGDEQPEQYFVDDCEPDYRTFSEGGELPLEIHSREVYAVGGHIEICMSQTLHDVLQSWARNPVPRQRMTLFMDGVYSNGKSIQPDDPYYEAFTTFIGIVTYGRPGGESWPKLNLLETLGIIVAPLQQYAYLERILPHYERTFPSNYRVELQLNDAPPRVLQKGSSRNPPIFQFRFVDSALGLEEKPLQLR
jgi:hypothetical protein